MIETTHTLQSTSGRDLHLRMWEPEDEKQRTGSVILAHGLGEHCGRYPHVARFFTERGFAMYGADFIGFGQSAGKRGHIPGGVRTCVADLHQVAQLAEENTGGNNQQMLLGHSMGGLFVLRLLLDHPQVADGAIVAGPALHSGKGGNPLKIIMVRMLRFMLPSLTIDHGIPAEQICSDQNVVAEYTSDPLVHRQISMNLAGSILKEGERVRAEADQLHPDLSLLLLHGAEDKIAAAEDTRAFGQRASLKDVEVLILDGMRHEVFNEKDKDLTFQAVDQFFDLAPLGS